MHPEIEEKLRLCPTLPTISSVALRIIKIGRDPDVDLREVANLLSSDPALASKTLRVANSALYVRARAAQNLHQAINVLGLNATVSLALSFSLGACLRDARVARVDLDYYWRRALLSALAARLLGADQGMHTTEELFLAGLLQDLGVLALDAALPQRYAQAAARYGDHEGLIAVERDTLGTDHCEAGAWLMGEWGLPEYLSIATRHSHAIDANAFGDFSPDIQTLARCVALSGRIADIYIADDTDIATRRAMQAAQVCLQMPPERLGELLGQMAESMPEIESLFEITLLSATQAIGLTDQARELLASRNLQLLQSATQLQTREREFRRQADILDDMARRDPLTGVFNRRHFDEMLDEHFNRAASRNEALSIAYLDLDHFKSINDRYGHGAGDNILVGVARRIQSQLREDDLLARYGGEEFVLLMPNVDGDSAHKIVNRIRNAIEAMEHPVGAGRTLRVTLSAGIAHFEGATQPYADPSDFVKAADEALYRAKNSGRNRVIRAN